MSLSSCAPISSGSGFLESSLGYFDCAGQAIGSAGYTALVQPGSVISQLILAAITLFIAWHGVRMMFGRMPDMGEAVIAVAKIGLVLMLVTSWPAVRTLFAGPSFAGPTELVAQTGIERSLALENRLQNADDGIVALTKWGTGKLDIRAGRTADGRPAATEFSGIAMTDSLALGLGRLAFLIGALTSLGLLKLLAGVMISALPIFAGLLLFDATRGIFLGWLRLIFALFVASFAVPLILVIELSLLEPWLAQAVEQRAAFYATPSAPTELVAISGSFLLILIGSITLIVRACFAVDVAAIAGRWQARQRTDQGLEPIQHSHIATTAFADRLTGLSRGDQLAMTLHRLEQQSAAPSLRLPGQLARVADNDAARIQMGRTPSAQRRARQRAALSHSRRSQR